MFKAAECVGTTTLFEVDYYEDDKAYLTQSGQLYNEATAASLGRSYCFGPVFRAEKSKTRRHLIEFWMVEPEMAYAHLDDVMTLGEGLINFIVERVLNDRQEELKVLERDVSKLEAIPRSKFPRVHYDDAVKILQEGFAKEELENNFEWGWTSHTFILARELNLPAVTGAKGILRRIIVSILVSKDLSSKIN